MPLDEADAGRQVERDIAVEGGEGGEAQGRGRGSLSKAEGRVWGMTAVKRGGGGKGRAH